MKRIKLNTIHYLAIGLGIIVVGAILALVLLRAPKPTPSDITTQSSELLPPPHLGYGINVRDSNLIDELVDPLGLDWIRLWEEYSGPVPSDPLPYNTLYTLNCNRFIVDTRFNEWSPDAWRSYITQLATAGIDSVQAYEICNEMNVEGFWNGLPPNPELYTQMLCEANTIIKDIDPNAVVVTGGLAPVGRIQSTDCGPGNNCHAMDEREYLQSMLNAGAADCMDAFGYHPYGFSTPPEADPDTISNGFTFRGVEKMHAILENNGYPDMPVWATEYSWLRAASSDGINCDSDPTYWNYFKWQEVTAEQQADYLTRSFAYADANWPWMQVMFIWNSDWYDYKPEHPCLHSRFYSLRSDDGSLLGAKTPAYTAIAAMDKRVGFALNPILTITPPEVTLLAQSGNPTTFTPQFDISNTGYDSFSWYANLWSGGIPGTTLYPMYGNIDTPLTVTIDSTGLAPGTYTQVVGIYTSPSDVDNAPGTITVTLKVVDDTYKVYLPQVAQSMYKPEVVVDPHGPSKIGTHAISDGGTLELVNTVANAGGHVAVVKGLSFGYLCEVKQISPETITIGRWADYKYEAILAEGDPVTKAQEWMNVHMSHWNGYGHCVDYWEVLNEVDPPTTEGHVWQAEFFKAAMDIAEQNGYKLALFSYSMGVPEMWEWRAIADTGVFARAQQGGHILSLHEYAWPNERMGYGWGEPLPQYPGQDPQDPSIPRYPDRGNLTGRYRHLYRDILIPRGEVIPLVITEANLLFENPVLGDPIFIEEMIWYDDKLREDDYVIGMTIFTLGGQATNWASFDFNQHIPALATRIISLKDQ